MPLTVIRENREYQWPINPPPVMLHDEASKVNVAIFLGRDPAKVVFHWA